MGGKGWWGTPAAQGRPLPSHSLYAHVTTATKQPFPTIREAALHCACTASPSLRTTATKKLNPNRAAGNPRSSQPHWARVELYPQLKPHLGFAQGQAGRGCGALAPAGKASDLGNSHFPEINFFSTPV